ncbi:Hypothetical protein, putative [Bodo saltans]|uniref:Uncharacterized protein n=1 Tax=Bodo saltans TaxID=75058 RepID=A0A0S4IU09_BODSA|nr:Hypothetical protein, putative [Bodo saltans]|eukprot:CUG07766.1 Hypothetical protein, putative [Bodo saltans]
MVGALVIDRTRRRDGQKLWKLRKWSDIKDPITELFRLGFSLRSEAGDAFHSMWQNLSFIRDNMRGNPNAEDIWSNVTKEICSQLLSLVKDAQAQAAKEIAAAKANDSIVALVSGRQHADLINQRYSVDSFVAGVMGRTLNARFMGTGIPMLNLTLEVTENFVTLVKDYKLPFAAQSLAKSFLSFRGYLETFLFSNLVEYATETGRNARQNEIARLLRESRTVFQKEVAVMERTFEVALLVQRLVLGISNWQCLSDSVSLITRILIEFLPEDKPAHLPLIAVVYKALADVFLQCHNRTFHAYCLTKAASAHQKIVASAKVLDKKAVTAASASVAPASTAAVLAALAAPDISERRNQFGGNDVDFRRLSDIAEMFKIGFPPSRSTLCTELRTSGVLDGAQPAAKELFTILTADVAPIDVCGKTAQYLTELVKTSASIEETFGSEVRRFALTRYFLLVAETKNSISLRDANANVGFAAAVASHEVLNVLLDEVNIPVLVDQGASEVTFTSASLARMHNTFSQLAQAAAPARVAVQPKRQPLRIDLTNLELESNRLIAFHSLVKDRVKATVELKEKRIKQIHAQKESKKQAIIDVEVERQRKIQEENNKRMAREYQLAELKERRKLLIHRVQEKHKGLKVNPAIIDLNQQSFMDNLTAALTEFQRRLETAKRADVRKMDHFERACREKDTPKRKALAESMAGELETERQTRWENSLLQHRKEFDEKAATRARLQKFLPHAAKYEATLAERSTKTTKRDEQEDLLKAEKARLALASGQTAAPAAAPVVAAAPTATPASTDAAADLPVPVAGAKWAARAKKADA